MPIIVRVDPDSRDEGQRQKYKYTLALNVGGLFR
ncbi:RNA polymerase subunit sigma [Kosakonia cowanii]|nr:RNA polymerase subunit sigma [Kosakonia cowanii]